MTCIAYTVGAALVLIVLLPVYAYLGGKFWQVGRMSGANWFTHRCRKEASDGTNEQA